MNLNKTLEEYLGEINNFGCDKSIDFLKNTDNPIVVFGGGGGGKAVAELLKQHGVEVDAFCESASFYSDGKELLGKPIFLYDTVKNKYSKYELVLGASGKSILSVMEAENRNGNNVFAFQHSEPLFSMSDKWVKENVEALDMTFQLLEDDLSKETFLSYINDKAGNINEDIRPLWKLWIEGQYFNSLYNPANYKDNVMVDCGAWIGDTAEEFLSYLRDKGYKGKVYAFEPDPDNYRELIKTANKTGCMECFKYVVGKEKKKVSFETGNSSCSCISKEASNGELLDMIPVDDVLRGKYVSFVKMDLEGGEEDALIGMHDLIVENAPFLAICVYHKLDDLIRIPRLIKKVTEETGVLYKYYLRHHSCTASETVFYAVPMTE